MAGLVDDDQEVEKQDDLETNDEDVENIARDLQWGMIES
jgi:hypothetical protein